MTFEMTETPEKSRNVIEENRSTSPPRGRISELAEYTKIDHQDVKVNNFEIK